MSKQALAELKDKISQTRQSKNNGGFPASTRPSVSPKEKRVLKGHFGKGKGYLKWSLKG